MINFIKSIIKKYPKIYDYINSFRPIVDDVEIWIDTFSRTNKRLNFIQVGANDGLRWDPLRRFILRDGWSGVLIEPIFPVFKMLKNNYSYVKNDLVFENCIISNHDGFIDFYTVSDEFLKNLSTEKKLFYLRKSSIYKDNLSRHVGDINSADCIVSYQVRCLKLDFIIDKYFFDKNLDLVFIDAEGHDDDVIKSIDFNKCKPRAIFYESHNLGSKNEQIKLLLSSNGYEIIQFKGDAVGILK